MKRKTLKKSRREKTKMKGSLARHLSVQLGHVSLHPLKSSSSSSSIPPLFSNLFNTELADSHQSSSSAVDIDVDGKDFILSQDFFCTPDYITPDPQPIQNSLDSNKENMTCPKSPEKLNTTRSKRIKQDGNSLNSIGSTLSCHQQAVDLMRDAFETDELKIDQVILTGPQKNQNYVSQSAVALRCRVMPPPCIMNPYFKDPSQINLGPFDNQRSKCTGLFPSLVGGDGLSRYRTDFHEIEEIGNGNFSRVFKVLKRIDGCMYAVKQSTRLLHQDTDRRKALMEVQAMAALESHENIVRYYSSWFELEKLYIQMELCERSLCLNTTSQSLSECEVLEAMHQIAKALEFMHERGIAHLDVKPDNIYVKKGVYKLGDFGCVTLLDKSLPIDEGDARYMPHEMLNDKYDHLDKVDIFSLGAAIYELIRGSQLPESGPHFLNLREGKLPLLPGHSLQFQNLLKMMVDPDPVRRPSAKEVLENPLFDKLRRAPKIK